MTPFTYEALPARIIFGNGTISGLPTELSRLGRQCALILSTPEQRGTAEMLAGLLGTAAVGVFAGAAMHSPVNVTVEALHEVDRLRADAVVSVGGGRRLAWARQSRCEPTCRRSRSPPPMQVARPPRFWARRRRAGRRRSAASACCPRSSSTTST